MNIQTTEEKMSSNHDDHGKGNDHGADEDHEDGHHEIPWYRKAATGGHFDKYKKEKGKPPPPPMPAPSIIDHVVDDMKDIYPPKVRKAIAWGTFFTLLFSGALGAMIVWTAIKIIEFFFIAAVTPIL